MMYWFLVLNRIEQAVTQHPLTDLVLFNFERFDDENYGSFESWIEF